MISSFQSHPTDQPNWPSTQDETSIASWKTWALQKIHLNQSFPTFFSQTDLKETGWSVWLFPRTHMHTSTNLKIFCVRFCWGQSDIHWYFQQCNMFPRDFHGPLAVRCHFKNVEHEEITNNLIGSLGATWPLALTSLDRCRSFGLCLSHVPWH